MSYRDDDVTLVARVRAGDDAAFHELVARHRPKLVAHARRILGARGDQAEDVAQEALLRAHRALRRDDREMRLVPWLLKLTRNCALDELARLHGDAVPLDSPAAERALSSELHEPHAVHERRDTVQGMLEGIAYLPDEQRHALLRREVDGASHAEVAAELGITSQASRALVFRARDNLTKYEDARDARCLEVQDDLLRAHRAGRRASAHAHRHLLACGTCRAYRARLRSLRRALHVLHPGPLLVLAALGVKGLAAAKAAVSGGTAGGGAATGGTAAAGGGAAVAAKAAGGLVALLAAGAGSTLLFTAGDPSPLPVRSPAVPGGAVEAGEPLPRGTAIVARLASPGTTVRVSCPPGHRVADLLPPQGGRLAAGYVETIPGRSRTARVALGAGDRHGVDVGIAILCRRPRPDGSIVPAAAVAARSERPGAVCVRHVYLRSEPRGAVAGSARLGQPLRVREALDGWSEVRTDLGATGWIPSRAVCG